jgi:hypothetical protein
VRELGRFRQVKPVQQRSGVELHDTLRHVGRDRGAQLMQVAREAGGIQQQAVASGDDRLVAQCGAEHVDRQIEQPAAPRIIPLGP